MNKKDNENNKHPCAGAQKSKLSKLKKTMRGNNESNEHPMAQAPRNLNYLN